MKKKKRVPPPHPPGPQGPIMTLSLIDNFFFQLSIMSELAESFQSTPELNSSIKYNHQELMEELDRMNRELKEMKESVLKTSGKFRFLHIQIRKHLLSPRMLSSSCYVVYQRKAANPFYTCEIEKPAPRYYHLFPFYITRKAS